MNRLEAFEAMLSHIQRQAEYEKEQMERFSLPRFFVHMVLES